MIRVALSDIQFSVPLEGLYSTKKRGPRLLTGEIEKRMGDRGTPTSNRREGRALYVLLLFFFIRKLCEFC